MAGRDRSKDASLAASRTLNPHPEAVTDPAFTPERRHRRSAIDAETALNAVNAVDAHTVNGFGAGCARSRLFARACWDASPSAAATAPAAASIAPPRGALPEALQLAAFAGEEGVSLDEGGAWSGEIVSLTSANAYSVATVSPTGVVASAVFDAGGASDTRKYRCVIPLVS